jgi:phosphate acetyltransferase
LLASVEVVNPRRPATLDVAALCKMADRGQITGGIVNGPWAFYNAIGAVAATGKGIVSAVAGQADILVVSDLDAGNRLAKEFTCLSGAEAVGMVLGAAVPRILTSRADNAATRLASCALGALVTCGVR